MKQIQIGGTYKSRYDPTSFITIDEIRGDQVYYTWKESTLPWITVGLKGELEKEVFFNAFELVYTIEGFEV